MRLLHLSVDLVQHLPLQPQLLVKVLSLVLYIGNDTAELIKLIILALDGLLLHGEQLSVGLARGTLDVLVLLEQGLAFKVLPIRV